MKSIFQMRTTKEEQNKIKMRADKEKISKSKLVRLATDQYVTKAEATEQFRSLIGGLDLPTDLQIKVFDLFNKTINK